MEAVGIELSRLIQTLRDGPTTSKATTTTSQISIDDKPYLAHTGMVWDAVDRLADLSWTEVEAVQKRIKGQRAIVDDAWSEFKEFLAEQDEIDGSESGEEDDDLDGLDDEDDEWGDLEKALGGSKLNKEERARADSVSLEQALLSLNTVRCRGCFADQVVGKDNTGFTSSTPRFHLTFYTALITFLPRPQFPPTN